MESYKLSIHNTSETQKGRWKKIACKVAQKLFYYSSRVLGTYSAKSMEFAFESKSKKDTIVRCLKRLMEEWDIPTSRGLLVCEITPNLVRLDDIKRELSKGFTLSEMSMDTLDTNILKVKNNINIKNNTTKNENILEEVILEFVEQGKPLIKQEIDGMVLTYQIQRGILTPVEAYQRLL